MNDRVDIGEDKNIPVTDPNAPKKNKITSLMMDDLPKTADDALHEAKRGLAQYWINSEPLLAGYTDEEGNSFLFFLNDELKKRVTLLFFCDFSLLQCMRSLKYIVEWHKRYSAAGLMTILIHSPIFEFGKDRNTIEQIVQSMKMEFPVVLDNDFAIWKALENRYWPRRVLFAAGGEIFHDTVGEKEYQDFEMSIQHLLRKVSPGLSCPPLAPLIHKFDDPAYSAPPTTGEIFFGLKRKPRFGNLIDLPQEGTEITFKHNAGPSILDVPYFDGVWTLGNESAVGYQTSVAKPNPFLGDMKITIHFTGTDAYIVAKNRGRAVGDVAQYARIAVLLNKRPIPEDFFGTDVTFNDARRGVVVMRGAQLYHIASKLDYKSHELTIVLEKDSPDTLEVFAMFFETVEPINPE